MSLTDLFISPAGAGDESGSSVANALPAISGGDWSTDIEALDRAGKRFVWLTGTYNCTTQLTFSGSAPTVDTPNFWVGADASGNVLRPKFDETGLRIVTTDYPKIIISTNNSILNAEEHTSYSCLSFENTNASYSKDSIVEATAGDTDIQHWFGCSFKAAPANNNAEIMLANNSSFHTCSFEATTTQFARVLDLRANGFADNCRIIGGGKSSGSGDGHGVTITANTTKVTDCVIVNVHGNGYDVNSTNTRMQPFCENCTIANCGGNGLATAGPSDNQTSNSAALNGNIVFSCNRGINANADDGRQPGMLITAMGDNTSGNFNNMDDYEDMVDVIAITSADFYDSANNDFRIKRESPLYKFYGNQNFGAIQNEDFEFVSVS